MVAGQTSPDSPGHAPGDQILNYTFDFADRPLSALPAAGTALVTSAKYRPFGPLEQIRYGNGTTLVVVPNRLEARRVVLSFRPTGGLNAPQSFIAHATGLALWPPKEADRER